MSRFVSILVLLGLAAEILCGAPKDGVGLNKISLPKGPGSIEGLGSAFEPQLNSGTASYSVKIAVPPGVNGLQPEVVLSYNGGSGNSPFGIAWGWEPMCIQRQTEKGLPTYGAGDTLIFLGEELVHLDDGSYRVENESGFFHVRREGDGWLVRDRKGTRYKLGQTASSRVSRPGGLGFNDTFKWCLEEVIDTHGNRMVYDYVTFPDSPGQLYCERIRYSIGRSNPAIFHSVEFRYAARGDVFGSYLSGFEIRTGRRCERIDVRSQDALVRRYGLAYELSDNDPVEPVSRADAGLAFSLLRRVTQFDRTEPGGSNSRTNYLPPLQFGYTRFDVSTGIRGVMSGNPPISFGNPNLAIADINADSLPDLLYTDPILGGHEVYYNLGGNRFGPPTPFVWAPWNLTLDVPETQLADFDGDGRVDLVQKYGSEDGRFVYYPNTTAAVSHDESHPAWGQERSFGTPYPPFTLDDPGVRSLDLDGDKRMDYLRTTPFGLVEFLNRSNRWEQVGQFVWGEDAIGGIESGDAVQFDEIDPEGLPISNRAVKLADLNGDRLLDIVRLHEVGGHVTITWWPNRGRGLWAKRESVEGALELDTIPMEDLFIEDINGDGLADAVAVDYDELRFWINQGNGRFSAQFRRTGMPAYQRGVTVLRQADLNGNGSTDFVWENYDSKTGLFVIEYYDFLGTERPNLLRTIDNGIGLRTHITYRTTTDYAVEAREGGQPWTTRLPFPTTVVSSITREIGLDLDGVPGNDRYQTDIVYFDGFYDSFERQFRGFAFAKKVERGDERYPQIPLASPATVTRLRFHTGAPDGEDNNGDGTADEFSSIGGYEEESIKGRVLWTEVTRLTADVGGTLPAQRDGQLADDSVVFTREINRWQIKTLHSSEAGFQYREASGAVRPELSLPFHTTDGRRVSFAFLVSQSKDLIEANGSLAGPSVFTPKASPKRLLVEHDFDFYGNAIAERNHGVYPDTTEYDDERFTLTDFAFNLDAWIIGLPSRSRVTDENGLFVSETRRFYDGPPFTGLSLGSVGLVGDVMREQSMVNGEKLPPAFEVITNAPGDPRLPAGYAIDTLRNRYDDFGNLIVVRDALWTREGEGHEREYGYDPVFATFVEREVVKVGGATPDLVATAAYNYGAGVMTGFLDFNGNATRFQYDSFWRLVGIVKPGDTPELPSASFEYRPADPFRSLVYLYAAAGDLTLQPNGAPTLVNAVWTRQRERSGTPDTFDTVSFTDGLGHKLGTLHESDRSGQWIAKDFKRYSSQGEERLAVLPFEQSTFDYLVPDAARYSVATFFDEAGRPVRTLNPPETDQPGARRTETRTVFLPLSTLLFDEEDCFEESPYFNTPHIQWKDGLDRLIGVTERTRLNDDGTPLADPQARADWLTRYAYDLSDNLSHIIDSQGNQKWFRYDGLKRKLFMNDPDRGVMFYRYDDAANLLETVDAKNQRITYSYDGVNRLLSEKYHDGEPLPTFRSILDPRRSTNSVAYFYDAPLANVQVGDGSLTTAHNVRGMLSYVQDLSGEEHTSYDNRGRVEWVIKRLPDPVFHSSTNPAIGNPLVSYRTGFNYDALDRIERLIYPDNDEVGYEYSDRNQLRRIIGGPSGSIISNILYQPSDQQARIDYGNGVRTTYEYDPRLRLNRLLTVGKDTNTPAAPLELIHFTYEFDGASNIRTIRDRRPGSAVAAGDPRRNTQLYQYDDLYRITRAQYSFALPDSPDANNGVISYRYDRIGNMLNQSSDIVHFERGVSVTDLGEMRSGGTAGRLGRVGRQPSDPPGPHALSAIVNPKSPVGNRSYPYDANGNMAVIDGLTNRWDFKDRLIGVADTNMAARYTYDYADRRVLKRVGWKHPSTNNPTGADSTAVLYPDKYFEVREADAPVKYVWNGSTRVARVTGSLATDRRTQRLRVYTGMNLVSLAITATNALGQLVDGASVSGSVKSAMRWNPSNLTWQIVASSEKLVAGTVFWLELTTNALLAVTGNYSNPTSQSLRPGVNFVSGWGLQPLELNNGLITNFVAWHWLSAAQSWHPTLSHGLTGRDLVSLHLAPGEALIARIESDSSVGLPESVSNLRFYHQDHLGSTAVMSDTSTPALCETANYAFGMARIEILRAGFRESYVYTQKERDGETGHNCFEARFLSSGLSRFTRHDDFLTSPKSPWLVAPQLGNPFAYCGNNPLKYVDPSGRSRAEVRPNQQNLAAASQFAESFIAYIKEAENAAKDGYDVKTDTWTPHKSPEGGTKTVAYGHKLGKGDKENAISSKEADDYLQNDLNAASIKVARYIKAKFKADYASLSESQREALVDFVFNLGGLEKFPICTKAILDAELKTMKEQCIRKYTDPVTKTLEPLKERNRLFNERFLKVDQPTTGTSPRMF